MELPRNRRPSPCQDPGHVGPCGHPAPSLGLLTSCPHSPPPQKREAFCQLLQLMKNRHSNQDEPDMISLFIGSWNMGESCRLGCRVHM